MSQPDSRRYSSVGDLYRAVQGGQAYYNRRTQYQDQPQSYQQNQQNQPQRENQQKQSQKNNKNKNNNNQNQEARQPKDIFNDVYETLVWLVKKPRVAIILLAVVLFYIDHAHSKGFVHKRCDGSTNAACIWILGNFENFQGFVVMAPFIYDLPEDIRPITGALTYAAVYLLPSQAFWVYGAAGVAIHTFFRSKNTQTKLVLAISAAVIYAISAPSLLPTPSTKPP